MTHSIKALPITTVEMEAELLENAADPLFSNRMKVKVKYAPFENEVTEIVDCWVVNRHNESDSTIISNIMINKFKLDGVIDQLFDWAALYNEKYKD